MQKVRVSRAVWVLLTNGCLAWLTFTRLSSLGFGPGNRDPQLWFEFVFELVAPVIGIVLELMNERFARLINVGCFTVPGLFWFISAILSRSAWTIGFVIFSLALLTIAALNKQIVYTRTKPA